MIYIAALRAFYNQYMFPRNGIEFDDYVNKYGYDIVTNYYQGFIYSQEATRVEQLRMAAESITVDQMRQFFDKASLLALSGMEFEEWMQHPGYEQRLREKTFSYLAQHGLLATNVTGWGVTGKSAFEIAAAAWSNHEDKAPVQRPVC